MSKIELLPQDALVKTSEVDHAEWNYRPVLSLLQRARFRLIARLLQGMQADKLLDIGYGSGVFFPHLSRHARELYGVDIHDKPEEVTDALKKHDLDATLVSASVSETPFDDNMFDCAVAVSSMEYVVEIEQACQELVRILKPGGSLILVTPGQSAILDFGLKLLGGEDAEDNYGDRRQRLLDSLEKYFRTQAVRHWPPIRLPGLTVYKALSLTPR